MLGMRAANMSVTALSTSFTSGCVLLRRLTKNERGMLIDADTGAGVPGGLSWVSILSEGKLTYLFSVRSVVVLPPPTPAAGAVEPTDSGVFAPVFGTAPGSPA